MSPTEFTGLIIFCIGLVGAAALCLRRIRQDRTTKQSHQIPWPSGEPSDDTGDWP